MKKLLYAQITTNCETIASYELRKYEDGSMTVYEYIEGNCSQIYYDVDEDFFRELVEAECEKWKQDSIAFIDQIDDDEQEEYKKIIDSYDYEIQDKPF